LTGLESCRFPFEIPGALVPRKANSRAGPFGDGFFECSVSQDSSFDAGPLYDIEKATEMVGKPVIQRKPLPTTRPEIIEVPDRSVAPLLPVKRRDKQESKGWGDEWTYTARQTGLQNKEMTTSNSVISFPNEIGPGNRNSSENNSVSPSRPVAMMRRPLRPRSRSQTRPSSNIGNISRGSPLSSVR